MVKGSGEDATLKIKLQKGAEGRKLFTEVTCINGIY